MTFIFGAVVSVCATLFWATADTADALLLGWVVNRFGQAFGWASSINILGQWVPAAQRGKYFGCLTLAFLLGDALARAVLSLALFGGLGWRAVVVGAAGVCAVTTTAVMLFLRPSRAPQPQLEESAEDGGTVPDSEAEGAGAGGGCRGLWSWRLAAAVGASIGIHTIRTPPDPAA